MYLLYRSRHLISWLPVVAVAGWALMLSQQPPLNIQPRYDESTMELALAEPPAPEPEPQPEPLPEPLPEPETPPMPLIETPAPVVVPPPPKPRPVPKAKEKRPAPKPVNTRPAEKPRAVAAPKAVAAPAAPAKPAAPAAATPANNAPALEGAWQQALRRDLDARKRYPTGRQASLERPEGNVEVWLEVDRSGRVLASGISTKARSMLLNRAALSSLQGISQVKPFPPEAFTGQSSRRFTATFTYRAP